MNFDFSKLDVTGQQARPIDPIDIFQGAAVTDGNINDLWLGQGDALRGWNAHRDKSDVAVALNTGAGKTLVGLLIAQSLVNETRRQVVYACSSIQLVQQTASKAQGYGLPAATYFRQKFSQGELYHRAEAPCVTTYQALFNGKSRFGQDDIAAVVFDDAHTADQILRNQFSLSISRSAMARTFDQILAMFQPYHNAVGLASSYAEIVNGVGSREFLIPPFEVQRNLAELRRLLVEASLGEFTNTRFAWEFIRDHEDLCCLLITNKEITFTPPVVPVSSLPCFSPEVRRVYLSATLSAPDSFVRAFGRKPDYIVAPSTTAGECERMILIPSTVRTVRDDIASATEVIKEHKALILVPSFHRAERWNDIAEPPATEDVSAAIDSFRDTSLPEKLILAARYDGLDLPGDTCRMLVLDELPHGAGPLERFQWERLNMQSSLRSLLASRIVQSFGRISRGMSDHGVVVLTGKGLVEWLSVPRNRSLLPKFLQKQIEIGESLSRGAPDTDSLKSIVSACLARDSGWVQAYTRNMQELPPGSASTDQGKAVDIALAEAHFGKALWERDYQSAARALNSVLQIAYEFSQFSGAWLSLWLGYALEMSGDRENASQFYRKAHSNQSNIPRPTPLPESVGTSVPAQVTRISEQMRIGYAESIHVEPPRTLVQDLAPLNGNGSSAQIEEAIRCLGQFLGLHSTRPDKEFGTGPDVLWIGQEGHALCIEVKADKQDSSLYRKDDVGQLHNHIQWVRDNHEVSDIVPVFVGPMLPASNEASPRSDMRVVELRRLEELGQRLVAALQDVAQHALPLSLENDLNHAMKHRNLMYPETFSNLEAVFLVDIPRPS